MKFISVSILFICLIAATFSNWFIIAAYNINQQFITSQLCENKNKPAMHCNGHCYLSKQLAKQETPSSPLNTKSNERFEIQLYCIAVSSVHLNAISQAKVYACQMQIFTPQQFLSNSFHPPQV